MQDYVLSEAFKKDEHETEGKIYIQIHVQQEGVKILRPFLLSAAAWSKKKRKRRSSVDLKVIASCSIFPNHVLTRLSAPQCKCLSTMGK